MPNKYEFDAVRWLRNNKGRIGTNRINGDDIATTIADEIQRLRTEGATLSKESEFYRKQCDMRDEWRDKIEAELAALKDAARPVVEACYAADVDGELDERIDGQMLFKLAALVGEE